MLSKKAILTPNAIYAYIDRGSDRHHQAVGLFRYFSEQRYKLFLDSISLNEVYDDIYHKMSRDLAKDFLKIITLSDINLVNPDEGEVKAAVKALMNYPTLDLTFSQSVLAVVAVRRNVAQVVTFDYLPPLFGLQTFYMPI